MSLPENDNQAEKVLKSLDEQHSKYKFMEMNMIARKRRLRQQLPDLQKSLEMIKILQEQEDDELETNVLLSEQVFVKSVIPKTKTVCLWLGANVMLEYPLDEAEELLKSNVDSANQNLRCLEHDQVNSFYYNFYSILIYLIFTGVFEKSTDNSGSCNGKNLQLEHKEQECKIKLNKQKTSS